MEFVTLKSGSLFGSGSTNCTLPGAAPAGRLPRATFSRSGSRSSHERFGRNLVKCAAPFFDTGSWTKTIASAFAQANKGRLCTGSNTMPCPTFNRETRA